MKLTDAQYGALAQIIDHGPIWAEETVLPPSMDGSRKTKLQCTQMTKATLERLETSGLVRVTRVPMKRPTNAVGKAGHRRISLTIHITDAGRAALASG